MFAKFALKNQRIFTADGTYLWMFLFSKHFLKLISECLMVSYSPSRALKNIYICLVPNSYIWVFPFSLSWFGTRKWPYLYKIIFIAFLNSWKLILYEMSWSKYRQKTLKRRKNATPELIFHSYVICIFEVIF